MGPETAISTWIKLEAEVVPGGFPRGVPKNPQKSLDIPIKSVINSNSNNVFSPLSQEARWSDLKA